MLSVYNYRDPIDYLNAFISLSKKSDPTFSIRSWSSSLGLKSTAPLLDVLKRKKVIRDELLNKLIGSLPIDRAEVMYFQAITQRTKAKTKDQEVLYDLIIEELRPAQKEHRPYIHGKLDLLSHWIYMAILSMANLENFSLTADHIKNALREDIDIHLIDKALFELFEYGFLVKQDDGTVIRAYTSHLTATDVKHEQTKNYVALICDLAKKSCDLPVEQREIQSFSCALAREDLPLAKEIIRKAAKQLTALSQHKKKDTVYQTNINFFPLTK